jgi:predicted TIM-barrel fold metal-dependent hydrolase
MKDFAEKIHSGRPLEDIEIIDLHAHLGPYFNMHIPASSASAIVKTMDTCGIDKAVISTTLSWDGDLELGNSMMLEAMSAHPGLTELDRTFATREVVMIKIHPSGSKCRLDDRRMNGIFNFAARRHLLVLVHTWLDNDPYGNQDIFAGVAADYPEVKWLMGHSGGPFGSVHAVELAQKAENIFLDITLSMCPAQQIEFFVREVGSERILFGTDNPFIDPRPQVGRVALANISDQDKRNIFGLNARRCVHFD